MVIAIRRAVEEAGERDPLLHAVARLRGSRVLAVGDPDEGRRALADAVAAIEQLPLASHDRELLLVEALWVGSTVDPSTAIELFRRLAALQPTVPYRFGLQLVQELAAQGLLEQAVSLLESGHLQAGAAGPVLRFAQGQPDLQARALRAELESLQTAERWPIPSRTYDLFAQYFELLPDSERWLERVLPGIEAGPDEEIGATYPKAQFRSRRQWHLFQLLRVIRAYKAASYVDDLLARYPELARGIAEYPDGPDLPPPLTKPHKPASYYPPAWNTPRFLEQQMADAQERFIADLRAENAGPRVLWPSCTRYRTAFWHIGRVESERGMVRLAEVPDRDFALLASIELAAGALQLPEYNGIRRS